MKCVLFLSCFALAVSLTVDEFAADILRNVAVDPSQIAVDDALHTPEKMKELMNAAVMQNLRKEDHNVSQIFSAPSSSQDPPMRMTSKDIIDNPEKMKEMINARVMQNLREDGQRLEDEQRRATTERQRIIVPIVFHSTQEAGGGIRSGEGMTTSKWHTVST